jgi:hypothetical protein
MACQDYVDWNVVEAWLDIEKIEPGSCYWI